MYEFGDTDGLELKGEKNSPLYATGKIDKKTYENTIKAAEKYGITVNETDQYGVLLAGTASGLKIKPEFVTGNTATSFKVKLNKKHDLPTRFATLAHELGMSIVGMSGETQKAAGPTDLHWVRTYVKWRQRPWLGWFANETALPPAPKLI